MPLPRWYGPRGMGWLIFHDGEHGCFDDEGMNARVAWVLRICAGVSVMYVQITGGQHIKLCSIVLEFWHEGTEDGMRYKTLPLQPCMY